MFYTITQFLRDCLCRLARRINVHVFQGWIDRFILLFILPMLGAAMMGKHFCSPEDQACQDTVNFVWGIFMFFIGG